MKTLLLTTLFALTLTAPAFADSEVPIDEDPMFAEMTGENDAAEAQNAGGEAGNLGDFEGSLEQAAEHFNQTCFENLGPASACFEDYETQTCAEYRISCRRAGHYSR